MSQTSLQLLLHAGELEYIVDTIKESRNKNADFVGGCLFGLWRNSLIQPVIQFVTGPGKGRLTSVEKMFKSHYAEECAKIVMDNHCLLHLGFWFSGSQQQQDIAKGLCFKNGHNVLLIVNFNQDANSRPQLSGEYYLKKNGNEDISKLYTEDILPDHSSFRLFKALTNEINREGALVSPIRKEDSAVKQVTESLVKDLPSRVQVEEAVTSQTQWYATEDGMQKLQLLFQYFQRAGIPAEMSRDTATQDMQFGFSGGYSLNFPASFPREMPEIWAPTGQRLGTTHRSEDVCRDVVQQVAQFLQRPPSSRSGGRRGGRY